MKALSNQQESRHVHLALVHHANQYLITDGYTDRQGMGEIIGLGDLGARRRGLLPLLQLHLNYQVPLNLHLSGTLIETLVWHYPQCFSLIKHLRRAGLLEMVGSTFSQNVMPFFSDDYNLRQIKEELWLYREHLGWDLSTVKTFWVPERVWDTEKLAGVLRSDKLLNKGYAYALLDDRLVHEVGDNYAGSARERFDQGKPLEVDAFMPWEIAGGRGLVMLPISKDLRYLIPPISAESFDKLSGIFKWLAASGEESVIAVYGDDMEKTAGVGGWDGLALERYETFLRWLQSNRWIRPTLINTWAAAGQTRARGTRKIERGTFFELARSWKAGEDYRGWYEDPNYSEHRQYLLEAEQALVEAEKRGADGGLLEMGWKHLLHSSYETSWHNTEGAYSEPKPLAPWAAALPSHARSCHIIAAAAEWFTRRDGRAHAELLDVDGDGEDELVLKNNKLFAVVAPQRGGRLIYLFDMTERAGRLVVGNVSDDWNLQEELNRYMDCPRNHPGALADVGYEHDRYRAVIPEAPGQTIAVSLHNIEPGSQLRGIEKQIRLSADDGHVCVTYLLPHELWRLSTEICLSPDYYKLLRYGRKGIVAFNGPDWRGWSNGSLRAWVRIDSRQATVWDRPYQEECGHGLNLRVTSFAENFHIDFGVGALPKQPCQANGKHPDGENQSAVHSSNADRKALPRNALPYQPPKEIDIGNRNGSSNGNGNGNKRTPVSVIPYSAFRLPIDELKKTGTKQDDIKQNGNHQPAFCNSNLNQVIAVTDPHFMRRFLNNNLPAAQQEWLQVRACQVRLLRPHHNKLTLEYNLRFNPARSQSCFDHTVIGTWRQDELNVQINELLNALWRTGFSQPHSSLTIARPLGYWSRLHLRLREKVTGKLLKEWIYNPEANWVKPMSRVADWIAKLHNSHVKVARQFNAGEELKALRGWMEDLLACDQAWIAHEKERIEMLMKELICLQGNRKSGAVCLTHGDFHPENIFVRGDSITVIDFEHSSMGEPAVDLGFFLSEIDVQSDRYWTKRGGRNPLDMERLAGVLLEEYFRKRAAQEALDAVPLYRARTYLKHLVHTVRMKGTDSPQNVTLWLDKTAACLKSYRPLPRHHHHHAERERITTAAD